jgi:hypothetical protein
MESLLVQIEQGTWVTDGSLADTDVAGETLVVTPTALTSNLYGSSTTWSFEVDCSTARVDFDTFSMITYDVDFMGAGFTGGACEFMQVSEDVRSCCKTARVLPCGRMRMTWIHCVLWGWLTLRVIMGCVCAGYVWTRLYLRF